MVRFLPKILLVLFLMSSAYVKAQHTKIEYIAHAAFVIESTQGTRVLIDPYFSYNQLGYTFPENIATDLVLITHPHYDHDGSAYFSENTPVYRDGGDYQYKDVKFIGINSKHSYAEQIGKSGNQNYNTLWVVEVDGIKIAHLGDNGLLTPDEIKKLKDVDYVIGHIQDEFLALFNHATYIPNHYLLPEITRHTNWMQPIDQWLEGKKEVTKLTTNTYRFPLQKPSAKILVFKPSQAVKEWPQSYYDALTAIKEGLEDSKASQDIETAIATMDRAIKLAPYVMDGYRHKAVLLSRKQKNNEVISVLEHAFTVVADVDWGTEARMRKLLADAYIATEQKSLAYNQYLWLSRHDRIVNHKVQKEAQEFIKTYIPE